MIDDKWYREECAKFFKLYGPELRRLNEWEFAELEHDFLGFFHEYAPVADLPHDFVILDMGCYMGIQAAYFAEHAAYIGVDSFTPTGWRFRQDNVLSFQQSIQDFIHNTLPTLDLDLNRCFAICSYVPDKEAQHLVAETFPYHKVVYCDDIISERQPDDMLLEEDIR